MIQAILSIPESEYWNSTEAGVESSIPDEAVHAVQSVGGQFTGDPICGTRVTNGRKIVNYVGGSTLSSVQAFIDLFSLDWEILAMNDLEGNQIIRYAPGLLIEYMDDIVAYDDDGQEISRTRPTSVGHIGRFAGWPDFKAEEE